MYIEAFKEKSQLNMNENIVWMFLSSSVYALCNVILHVLSRKLEYKEW